MKAHFKFEDLDVWKLAVNLNVEVKNLIKSLPNSEKFSLGDQLGRACLSISLNIAEGQGYNTDKNFIKFLKQARGSLYETITCFKILEINKYYRY